jgi:hypothetical protein
MTPAASRTKIGKQGAKASPTGTPKATPRASTPPASRSSSHEKKAPGPKRKAKNEPSPAPAEEEEPAFYGVPLEEGMQEIQMVVSADGEGAPGTATSSATPSDVERKLKPGEVRAYVVEDCKPELKPSGELLKRAHVLRWERKKAAVSMKIDRTALDLQLGAMLVKKNASPKEIVVAWDKKLKGCINKLDFCNGCRSLGLKADNKRLNALFDSFDDDGGG